MEATKCGVQHNGRDCGVYLLLFSEIAVACFLESPSWLAFRLKKSWREAVAAVSPERAHAYRAALHQTYNRGIALQEGIASIVDVDKSDGCDCGWAAAEMKWHHPDCPLHSDRHSVVMKRPASALAEEQVPQPKQHQQRHGARGSSSPQSWSGTYSQTSAAKQRPSQGKTFRKLKQENFGECYSASEQKAEELLKKYKLLPRLENRLCWRCGEKMEIIKWSDRQVLSCTGRQDGKRCQVRYSAETAYTPMYNCHCTKREFLMMAHCWSAQKRIDQTVLDTGINETKVSRYFAAFRDLSGWYICDSTRSLILSSGEVDLDAKVTHVSHGKECNEHRGRLFIMRERSSKRRKIVTMPTRRVGLGSASIPESNLEIEGAIAESLRPGAVAGGDGGQAIASSVKAASLRHGGNAKSIPLVYAVHGKRPKKQFTRLEKRSKADIPEELRKILVAQGRLRALAKTNDYQQNWS